MSMPAQNSDETSSAEANLDASTKESPRSRLPRANQVYASETTGPPPPPQAPSSNPQPAASRGSRWSAGCLPAFWTIASLISMVVNIILFAIILSLLPLRGQVQATATNQVSGLLGGLYHNFVKMDQATISRTISVDANIPLDIVVPVQTTTRITLASPAVINSPRVYIRTGGLTLDAPALVTLPAGTQLDVTLDFPLNVRNTIPVHLDVPVNIPLSETQLHEPFVGLQKVVQPWYCLVEPNAQVNGMAVCKPLESGSGAP